MDFDDTTARWLRRYVDQVAAALGLGGECACVDAGPPANAYVALEGRVPSFPEWDVALLWDEERGWSAALETNSDEVVLAYLGGPAVPPPAEVARFADELLRGLHPGDPRPVRPVSPRRAELESLLRAAIHRSARNAA
ncbi:DUF6292 family protein [Saccharothrix mutabilis subsp. mutabilis]|uniref:DUF6292 family protein n=1 Tax=Saccharothrix mutabilis subsp. mutabilis TaxID=66855 RepID=A0ABN0UVM1_9PSEU